MTDEQEKKVRQLERRLKAELLLRPEYKVGKYKPPVEAQWKPGQSGNPGGRPRGSKNKPKDHADQCFADMIIKKGLSIIQSRDGAAETTRNEAVFDAITRDALRGQSWSQRLYVIAMQKAESTLAATREQEAKHKRELLQAASDYKFGWEAELAERARLGTTGPEPVIHPDDIRFDPSGIILVYNFFTDQERVDNKRYADMAERYRRDLEELVKELDDPQQQEFHDQISREIEHNVQILERLQHLLAWKPYPIAIGGDKSHG